MIIENNKNDVTKSIDEELDRVENYIEQALFYARSSKVEKDYYIKKVQLRDIANECIKKNKSMLIHEKIQVNIHDVDMEVNTDSKWTLFILNQIIQNSVKYRKHDINLEIEMFAKVNTRSTRPMMTGNFSIICCAHGTNLPRCCMAKLPLTAWQSSIMGATRKMPASTRHHSPARWTTLLTSAIQCTGDSRPPSGPEDRCPPGNATRKGDDFVVRNFHLAKCLGFDYHSKLLSI